MRFLFVTFVMLFTASAALAQDVMTPAQFRDVYVERVTTAVPGATVTRSGDLSLSIATPATGEAGAMQINLDRAYSEYTAVPDQLDVIVGRWVRIATTPPESAQLPERIVSVVRTQEHVIGYTRALARDGVEPRLVWRPLVGDLVEMIAFDSPDSIQLGTEDSLRDLNITPEQAWALAPRNLPARLGALTHETVAPGIVWVGGGNGLAPSVLTNAQWCAAPENANALYLVVDRDAFLMAERPAGVEAITRARNGMVSEGSAFSSTLVLCEGGRLQAQTN
jgi:hypothetical protein